MPTIRSRLAPSIRAAWPLIAMVLVSGCVALSGPPALAPTASTGMLAQLPLFEGWFEGTRAPYSKVNETARFHI